MDKTKPLNIFFSISCHEALTDAVISSYLVQKNFKSFKTYKRLTITKKSSLKKFHGAEKYFDQIIEASVPKVPKNLLKYYNYNIGSIRLFHSIIQSGNFASNNKFDYIIYLNSGSWILNSSKIIDLLKLMTKKNYTFASRVQTFLNGKAMYFDDHFIIVNLKTNLANKIFKISPLSRAYLPIDFFYGGIHKNLFAWYSLFPKSSIFIYSDLGECFNEYGNLGSRFIPLSWDSKNFLLHSNSRYKNILSLRKKYLSLLNFKIDDQNIKRIVEDWNVSNNKIGTKIIENKIIFFIKLSFFTKLKYTLINNLIMRYLGNYPVSIIDKSKIN